MPVEYRVFFPLFGTPDWSQKQHRQKPTSIPPLGVPVSSNDIFVMYSKDLKRLFAGMQTFGGQAELGADSVIRYEYWVSEDNALSNWSFDRHAGMGMKTAGVAKWWEGTHRIVICRSAFTRNRRSKIVLRANAIAANFPFIAEIGNLVEDIKEHATPEKPEGAGDAAETFITDVFVPIAGIFV